MNGQTNGKSPHSIGAAALPPPMITKEKVEQGKGTADHLMPLGYFLRMGHGPWEGLQQLPLGPCQRERPREGEQK